MSEWKLCCELLLLGVVCFFAVCVCGCMGNVCGE